MCVCVCACADVYLYIDLNIFLNLYIYIQFNDCLNKLFLFPFVLYYVCVAKVVTIGLLFFMAFFFQGMKTKFKKRKKERKIRFFFFTI